MWWLGTDDYIQKNLIWLMSNETMKSVFDEVQLLWLLFDDTIKEKEEYYKVWMI